METTFVQSSGWEENSCNTAKRYAHILIFYEVCWKDKIKIRKILIVFVYYFLKKRENLVFFCSLTISLKSTKRDKILGTVCLE